MRVFIGPLEVAGIAHGLADGLREAGVGADIVSPYEHRYAYGAPPVGAWAPCWWARCGRWRQRLPSTRWLAKALAVLLQQLAGWAVLAWALPRYDAFVFLYGETITNTAAELALLRLCGKRSVVVFVGSDARPPYVDGGWFPADAAFDPEAARRATRRQQRKVRRLERGASVCVNAAATAHFQRRRYVDWFALGIPRAPGVSLAAPGRLPLRVLHSPSHSVLKGTAALRATVDRLRARGVGVELVTIEGRPNAEVLAALADCDLVVDQLYSDTPMAAFATEAASRGRAVLVGGHGAMRLAAGIAPLPLPPTLFVEPPALEAALEALLADAPRRAALGRAGHDFVTAHWAPAAVAGRLLRIIAGDVPAAWWRDPTAVTHLHGCGLPEALARAHVRALVERCGAGALQLDDKPALRQAFLDFARAAPEAA